MKRRNFIKLGAGASLFSSIPHYNYATLKEEPAYPEDKNTGQLLLKVKAGSKTNFGWTKEKITNLNSLLWQKKENNSTQVNKYGGNLLRKYKGTGYFRTEKINGKWWMIDPDGCLFLGVGITSTKVPDEIRESISELLWNSGFNSIGCWSEYKKFRKVKKPMPYTVYLDFIKTFKDEQPKKESHGWGWKRRYPNMTIPVFHPDFEAFADKMARDKVSERKNDPYCIGYYSDNELPFMFDALDRYLELPSTDHGNKAARKWLKDEKGKEDKSDLNQKDRMDFLFFLAEKYYSICNKVLKKYDPNHLYLGSRLHGYDISLLKSTTCKPVFEASAKHVDVVSVNLYGTSGISKAELNRFSEWADKPLQITEFYAKGMDSGLDNNSGAGFIVPTQSDRGDFYQNYTLHLLQSNACIGWDLYRYIDPEDSNKGMVDHHHQPYPAFLAKVKAIHTNKYELADYFHDQQQAQQNKLVNVNGTHLLYRNGIPFFIKGQIGLKDLDRLADAHGNAVKIYGDYSFNLEYTEEKDIAVLLNLDMSKYEQAIKTNDVLLRKSAEAEILDTVQKYKTNSSVMIWGLGDNVEFDFSPELMRVFWQQINELTIKLKEIDPNHPVITSISANHIQYLDELNDYVPEIDAVGINTFDPARFESLPEKIKEFNWKKPFIVTEFNYNTDCDILNAPFKVPFAYEDNSGNLLERTYQKTVIQHPLCLGAFMLT